MINRCLVCHKEFTVYPCYIKLGRGKYCSQKCSGISQINHVKRNCLVCHKEYFIFRDQAKRGIRKYCSRKCFNASRIGKVKKCLVCNKTFYSYRSDDKFHKHKYCSWECYIKATKEDNHWNWKGNDVGYNALHNWVKRKLGFPNKCEMCGVENEILDWANKDHTYRRNINNWIRLCRKCHYKYDLNNGYRLPLEGYRNFPT